MPKQRVVLITGASSGVGQSSARLLTERGYRVVGTSRKPAAAGETSGVTMLPLDVCSNDSVAACLSALSGLVDRLDISVNNAGYEMAGALEELSLDEATAQLETNFFGVLRMVKAVLPLMRRQKDGQIINVSSLAGLSPIPFMGIYSASKFALEGYTEALRLEVKPFNIRVSQIEAGFLRTPMMNNRQAAAGRIADYDPWRNRAFDAIRSYEENGPGPELVATTVLKIAGSRTPRLRYVVGKQARFVTRLRQFLPEGTFEQGVRSTFRLDRRDKVSGIKRRVSVKHRDTEEVLADFFAKVAEAVDAILGSGVQVPHEPLG